VEEIAVLLDSAVAGVPRWRRARTRKELAGYVDDAYAELIADGVEPSEALRLIRRRFGDPAVIASGFRALPPPYWARPARRSAGPLGAAVLGLVIGLALIQLRAPLHGNAPPTRVGETADPARLEQLRVRQVSTLQAPVTGVLTSVIELIPVSRRLGLTRSEPLVLEPSVQALTPTWLPDGYDPGRFGLLLTPSTTTQYFSEAGGVLPGIVVEVLRPDLATVFQVKERHVRPVWVNGRPGFYIDGEWEVRGPLDEQPAPATWRTDRSRSVLFAWNDLLVLVAGPADLSEADLLRIARSLQPG
jgi:hypothetical protein